MNTTLEFRIQNLLEIKGDKISAPMSPMLFAKEMAEHTQTKFNLLARIRFSDERIFQRREDGGLTGFDTLIIGQQYRNDLRLSLWVDEGVRGIPVAMAFQSDRQINITPVYSGAKYARKLCERELEEIFEFLFDNPQLMEIKQVLNP